MRLLLWPGMLSAIALAADIDMPLDAAVEGAHGVPPPDAPPLDDAADDRNPADVLPSADAAITGSRASLPAAADAKGGEGEQLVGVTVERACGDVQVQAPAGTVRHAPTLWGTYTLQKETFNKMSTYRQHSWLCGIPTVMRGELPGGTDETLKFTCPWEAKQTKPYKHWLYYDSEAQQWTLEHDAQVVAPGHHSPPRLQPQQAKVVERQLRRIVAAPHPHL